MEERLAPRPRTQEYGSGSSATSYVLTPAPTVGPYFVDEKLHHFDVTTNTTDTNVLDGSPLNLTLTIMEVCSSGCSVHQGAQVDIWQPRGRACTPMKLSRIHRDRRICADTKSELRVASSSLRRTVASEFTTQLFFAQTLIEAITTSVSPYNSSGLPDTTNARDDIYNSATQLTLQTASSGGVYTGGLTIGVQTS